jgi:hypothetical protein
MKLFSLCFLILSLAQAEEPLSKTVVLRVDLSSAKIKFTSLGYSSPMVKVIVPELAGETVLNHRNVGEDGPCLFTLDTFNVDDVREENKIIQVPFSIKVTREFRLDTINHKAVCLGELREEVTAEIKGFKFEHYLSHPLPERNINDCF